MKLKPCPFCGSAAHIYLQSRLDCFNFYAAKCNMCGVEKLVAIPRYVMDAEEIEMRVANNWNMRAAEHVEESEE